MFDKLIKAGVLALALSMTGAPAGAMPG